MTLASATSPHSMPPTMPADIPGELGMATFHYARMRFPYHAMRVAVVTGHIAYVSPKDTVAAPHFVKWEEQLHRPLDEIRADYGANALV